jgi:hypothetical protein
VSKYDLDAGIGIVHYVHSLIGFAGNTITKKDVDTTKHTRAREG